MRKILPLNFDWRFSPDFKAGYERPDFDDSGFQPAMLPHANIELPYNNFSDEACQFISCYRRRLFLASEDRKKRVILCFEGVMSYAEVYFNGQYVCSHKGGYTPFRCDVTEQAIYGGENVLTVKVDSTERNDIPPFGFVVDYLTYGGIYREVHLELTDGIFIEDVFVRTRNVLSEAKLIDVEITVANPSFRSGEFIAECFVEADPVYNGRRRADAGIGDETGSTDENGNSGIGDETGSTGENSNSGIAGKMILKGNLKLSGEPAVKLRLTGEMRNALLWDVGDPVLYILKARITGDGTDDGYEVRFGFREACFSKDGFYLNGRKLKLRGLNRHQSFPYVGYAMPASAQYKDAEILKNELGVNIVRLSHYPQSRHFLDRCDELGLLVLEEIPGWQHIGDEEWQSVALNNVEEMIMRDRSRPGVVLWGVRINESQDNDGFYSRTNVRARELDDTRQTCGIRNIEGSSLLEDVYTYNDFIHRGNNRALSDPGRVAGKEAPYLVTEHNGHMYPTKRFDNEAKRVEHALRHLRVLDSMYSDPRTSGAIGWCAFDYNTHKDFGSGDLICYHGVMDMFRIPKEAAFAYLSQQDEKPVLEAASSMIIGEFEAAKLERLYIFTNCDYVKLYKNGEFTGSYYPSKEAFPHLPHPPVIIEDFIGDQLEREEGLSKKDAKDVKDVLYAVVRHGDKSLPLKYKLKMGMVMLRTKMPYSKAVDLYSKYVQNWGCKSLTYEFTGYVGDKAVLRTQKGIGGNSRMVVLPDASELREGDTYDVCRVVIKHTDEAGNVLPFSNEAVSLASEGAGEIIGPETFALIGGARAFWVRSVGRSGKFKVTVSSERFPAQTIEFIVKGRLLIT
ncbi:MAG TPA: glycoside hydrolase family 2 TIM barrel-domain containing protein [Clostridia bacterium]|nr:glycoside hydrolase family 2 TIM barrel-domain containing protein [Clostridia bacterium]